MKLWLWNYVRFDRAEYGSFKVSYKYLGIDFPHLTKPVVIDNVTIDVR